MCDNEFKTQEDKIQTKKKIEPHMLYAWEVHYLEIELLSLVKNAGFYCFNYLSMLIIVSE